jgi:protein SCO1/2
MVGGSFTLVGTDGVPVTDSQFRGKYMLVYFGFTNCPDICPEEMKKISAVMETLDPKLSDQIAPLFITLDPNRDSCKAVEEYVKGKIRLNMLLMIRFSSKNCWSHWYARTDQGCN